MRHYLFYLLFISLIPLMSMEEVSSELRDRREQGIPKGESEGERRITPEEMMADFFQRAGDEIVEDLLKHKGKGSLKKERKKELLSNEKYRRELIHNLFRKYDKDKDGVCNAEEIHNVVNSL